MTLTFQGNQFVIQGPEILPGPSWEKLAKASFATTDIKAAVRFRSRADMKAERIFSKFMLTSFELPPKIVSPLGLDLYPFQSDFGVPHILGGNRTYLAHQPGLGKSAQAICAVNSKPGRALIVCPSFLKVNWAREITTWSAVDFPSIEVVPETMKRRYANWNADFIIVSDSMLLRDWVRAGLLAQEFRFVFIDEGHRFKTPEAARTVALFGGQTAHFKSPGLIYRSEHVCVLSGTPLLNRPIELWPILYAMAPELIDFMPYQDFGFHYGGAVQDERGRWRFVGSANEKELKNKIMGRFMQRITKKHVLKDLPDKVREVIAIADFDQRQPEIKAMDRSLLLQFRESGFERPKELGDYATVRHETGLSKIIWSAHFIDNILTGDQLEQIILFAHHRDVVSGLAKALEHWKPEVINGGVSLSDRTKIQDRFQEGNCRLIIGNIDAMNLGLTLTAATRVVFTEYSWTPALNEQAEDRAHRIGQKDSIFCQYLVLQGSIDEAILSSVLSKEKSIAKVMDA